MSTKEINYWNKKLLEFSCYIKLEKNGIEIKNKNLAPNTVSNILLFEKVYKTESGANTNHTVIIKNVQNELIFSFEIQQIEKIVDKLIAEGKLTMIVNKANEKIIVFYSKTTKDILENYIKRVNELKNSQNNVMVVEPNPEPVRTNKELSLKNEKKKKYAELYSNPQQVKTFKKSDGSVIRGPPIKMGKKLTDLPDDIVHFIFDFVDRKNITKMSFVSKTCRKLFDIYIEKLEFRHDIPSSQFNPLLFRFKNLKHLCFGKAKNLKNENFKYFNIELKNLIVLDISEIKNLNDASIIKLFSKTKPKSLKVIKINFFLDPLISILRYISKFYSNLETLQIFPEVNNITSNTNLNKVDGIITDLEESKRCFSPDYFLCIEDMLIAKRYLTDFSCFVFNASVIKNQNIFANLKILNIEILLIEKIKDTKILLNAINLTSLGIKEIVLIETNKHIKKLNKINFDYMSYNYENWEQLSSLDFDNDYIENFTCIFSKLKNLKELSLGRYANKEILRLVSLYLKNINTLAVNSNLINDENIMDILHNCQSLSYLDLRGCMYVQGNCFVDGNIKNLKRVKLSNMNYNYYQLMEYLKSKGIKAENYIIK
jgi:hypothetical protein